MAITCTPSALNSTIQAITNATGAFDRPQRKASVVYGLALAVLSRTGNDYTTLAALLPAIKDWTAEGTSKLEEYDAWIAINEALAQEAGGGGALSLPTAAEAVSIVNSLANGLTAHQLHAAETFLRCNLTII